MKTIALLGSTGSIGRQSLEVAETMEVNGKRTFGYDVPIVYRRAAD